jgi:hypothetical protein
MAKPPNTNLVNALLPGVTEDTSVLFRISGLEETPYFAALGIFISEYAVAEGAVHLVARALSGLSDEKARAIFGGQRISDLIPRIRSFLVIDNISAERTQNIESCLGQLNIISDQRDKLVHRVLTYKEAALHASNMMTAKSIRVPSQDVFKISDLDRMTDDCIRIFSRLYYAAYPDVKSDASETVVRWRNSPWRYTPSQPNSRETQPHTDQKAPPHRRPSSLSKPRKLSSAQKRTLREKGEIP